MHLIMTLELIPQLEPIPTWNLLHHWLFWPLESLWNRLQKNWNLLGLIQFLLFI